MSAKGVVQTGQTAGGDAGGALLRLPELHLRPAFGWQVLLGRAAAALLLQVAYLSQWLTGITGSTSASTSAHGGSPQEAAHPPPGAALPHTQHANFMLASAALGLSSNLVLLINGLLAAASVSSSAAARPGKEAGLAGRSRQATTDQDTTPNTAHGAAAEARRSSAGSHLELQRLQSVAWCGSAYEDHATAVNVMATVVHTCAQLVACAADAVVRRAPPPASRLAAVAAAAGLNLAVNGDAWWAFLPQLAAVMVAASALAAAAAPTAALTDGGHRQAWYLAGAALQLAVAAAAAVALQWWLRRRWLISAAAGTAGAPTGTNSEASESAPSSKYIATHRLYRVWPLPLGYSLNGATALLLPVSDDESQPEHDGVVSYCRQQPTTAPPPVRMSTNSRHCEGWSPLLLRPQEEEEDASGSRHSGSSGCSTLSRMRASWLFAGQRAAASATAGAPAGPMQPPMTPSQLDVARAVSKAGASAFGLSQLMTQEAVQAWAAADAEAEAQAAEGRTGAGAAASTAEEDAGREAADLHADAFGYADEEPTLGLRTDAAQQQRLVLRQLRAACATLPSQLPSSAVGGHPLAAAAAGAPASDELMRQALSTGGDAFSRGPSFDIQPPGALADALFSTNHAVSSYNLWMQLQPSPLPAHQHQHHPHPHHQHQHHQHHQHQHHQHQHNEEDRQPLRGQPAPPLEQPQQPQQPQQRSQCEHSINRAPNQPSTTQLHTLPNYVQAAPAAAAELHTEAASAGAAATAAAATGPASAPPVVPTALSQEPSTAFVSAVSAQLVQLNMDSLNSCSSGLLPELLTGAYPPTTCQQPRAPATGGDGDGNAQQQQQQQYRGAAEAAAAVAAAAAAVGLVFDEADVISGRVNLVQQLFALMPEEAAPQRSAFAGADDGGAETPGGAGYECLDRLSGMSQSVQGRPLSAASAVRVSRRAGALVGSPSGWPSTPDGGAAGPGDNGFDFDFGGGSGMAPAGRGGIALSGPSGLGAAASPPALLHTLPQRSRLPSGVPHAQPAAAQPNPPPPPSQQQQQQQRPQQLREVSQLYAPSGSDNTWVRMRIVHPGLLNSADGARTLGAGDSKPIAFKPHAAAPGLLVRHSNTGSTQYTDSAMRTHDEIGLQTAAEEECASVPGGQAYAGVFANALVENTRASADGGPVGGTSSSTSLQQRTGGWSVATADGDSRSTLLSSFGARALASGQNRTAAPAPADPRVHAGASMVAAASQPDASPASALFRPNGSGFLATLAVYPHGPDTATASVSPTISASASATSSVHRRTQGTAIAATAAAALGPRLFSVGPTSAAAGVFNLQQGPGFPRESDASAPPAAVSAAAAAAASAVSRHAQSGKSLPAATGVAGNDSNVPCPGGPSAASAPPQAVHVHADDVRLHAPAAVQAARQGRLGAAAVLDATAAAATRQQQAEQQQTQHLLLAGTTWEEEELLQSREVLHRAHVQSSNDRRATADAPATSIPCGAQAVVTPSGRQTIPLAAAVAAAEAHAAVTPSGRQTILLAAPVTAGAQAAVREDRGHVHREHHVQSQSPLQPLQPQHQLRPVQSPPLNGLAAQARAQRYAQAATVTDGGTGGGESTGGGTGTGNSSSGGSRRGRLLDQVLPRASSNRMPRITEHVPTLPEDEFLDPGAYVVVSRPLAGADSGRSPRLETGPTHSSHVPVWGIAAGRPVSDHLPGQEGEAAAAVAAAEGQPGPRHRTPRELLGLAEFGAPLPGGRGHDAEVNNMLLLSSNLDGAGDGANSFQSPFVFGQQQQQPGRCPNLMGTYSEDGTERGATSTGMDSFTSGAVPRGAAADAAAAAAAAAGTTSPGAAGRYAVVDVLASGPLTAPPPLPLPLGLTPAAVWPSWQLPTHQHAQHLPRATPEPPTPACGSTSTSPTPTPTPTPATAATDRGEADVFCGPSADAVAAAVHAATMAAAPYRNTAAAAAVDAAQPSGAVAGRTVASMVASAAAMPADGGGSSGARHAGLWASPDIDSTDGAEPSLALFAREANSCGNHVTSKLSNSGASGVSGANGVSGASGVSGANGVPSANGVSGANGVPSANALASAAASAAAQAVGGGRGSRARLAAVMTLGNWSPRVSLDAEGAGAVGGGRSGSSSEQERSGRGSASGWSWLRAGLKAAVAHGGSKGRDASQPGSSWGRKKGSNLRK